MSLALLLLATLYACGVWAQHAAPRTGTGTRADPYVLAGGGETPSMQVAIGGVTFFRIEAPVGATTLNLALYPCFGAVDYYAFIGRNQDSSPDHSQAWPAEAGAPKWAAHSLVLGGASYVTLSVHNVFTGDAPSHFQIDYAFDKELFLPPGDGALTVSRVGTTSAHLAWTATDKETDAYQVLYHVGNLDGSMMPGMIMGTYCGLQMLKAVHGEAAHIGVLSHIPDHDHKERKRSESDEIPEDHDHSAYDHVDHKVFSLFEYQLALSEAHMSGLRADTYYHVDVVIRRNLPGVVHPIHRTYHSVIVHTQDADLPSDGTSVRAFAFTALIASFVWLL